MQQGPNVDLWLRVFADVQKLSSANPLASRVTKSLLGPQAMSVCVFVCLIGEKHVICEDVLYGTTMNLFLIYVLIYF